MEVLTFPSHAVCNEYLGSRIRRAQAAATEVAHLYRQLYSALYHAGNLDLFYLPLFILFIVWGGVGGSRKKGSAK